MDELSTPRSARSPRRRLRTAAVGLAAGAAAAVGVGLVAPALASAQDQPTATAAPADAGRHGHPRARAMVTTVADAIGIAPRQVVQGLRDQQSIAQIATANGVDPQVVVDALVAKGEERIDTAVTNGRIDEARGAELKAKLPEKAAALVEHVFDGSRRPR